MNIREGNKIIQINKKEIKIINIQDQDQSRKFGKIITILKLILIIITNTILGIVGIGIGIRIGKVRDKDKGKDKGKENR